MLAERDVDYFRLDLQGRARVEIRTTMDLDTVGTLFDSEGEVIATSDDISPSTGNYNFRITEDLERGVYYLEVAGYSLSESGDYQVLARFDLAGDDHGDTFGSSSLLPLGPRLAGSVNDPNDIDWFRLDLPVTTLATVTTSSQDPVSVQLYLPNNDGTVQPYGGKVQPFRITQWHGTFQEGTYYFAVSGEVSAYNVRVEAEDIGCKVAPSSLSPVELSEFDQAIQVSFEPAEQ
ncbi:MAG: PPC domain-containing protein [Dehalococcoidia bacterium]|nr:PPC domain-containing protein [Dehalococcoidia bacterium]